MTGAPSKDPRPSLNFCDLPPWVIASRAYNDNPQPLRIQGTRPTHHRLFARLDGLPTWEERAQAFQDYMDVAFHLHQWRGESHPTGQLSLKNSYLRFLRGWLFDANSMEGAVLKGWVESRIGISPTYHRGPIPNIHSEHYMGYLADRMNGSARTHAILSQLDLLYEFVQYELQRRHPDTSHLTLYRGVYDFSEHTVLENLGENRAVVRLNNLNSFTREFERAWEFGTRVLEVRVPATKVFFDGSLIHSGILRGEEEVLVLGGEFELKVRVY
ncbi:MAG TPA: NAD(+)--dinitrogen-reductase ADP-D-ribosyltransferase [Deferrisomatales bacterium]|nr:NAD(+)--dinitrogen-reductase ADP-D-ribosyltransferase [Deferrisomatales bacterium]